jgi:UDP-GlcNAc:undecaprenyl-phosphate GlcNAc-1-phosphate transferase
LAHAAEGDYDAAVSGEASSPLFLGIAGMLAFLLAWLGTPLAIEAARATGFLDRPGGDLKTHRAPTPYLGGMAVFVPFLASAALVFVLNGALLGVLLAATLAALLGLMDDFGAMRWGVKLAGQGIILLTLLRADVRLQVDALPPWLNVVLTAAWMIAVINAVNFLDIMDGLAVTACAVASAFLLAVAVMTGEAAMASLSACLLGALLGYMRSSLPPARIFLGDCGSLFLGTTLGALALALDYSRSNPWAVVAPILILGVPLFEFAFTIGVRVLRRRRPWQGSPDHVALRLRRMGRTIPEILALSTAAGILLGGAATWLVRAGGREALAVTVAAACAAILSSLLLLRAPDPPAG